MLQKNSPLNKSDEIHHTLKRCNTQNTIRYDDKIRESSKSGKGGSNMYGQGVHFQRDPNLPGHRFVNIENYY